MPFACLRAVSWGLRSTLPRGLAYSVRRLSPGCTLFGSDGKPMDVTMAPLRTHDGRTLTPAPFTLAYKHMGRLRRADGEVGDELKRISNSWRGYMAVHGLGLSVGVRVYGLGLCLFGQPLRVPVLTVSLIVCVCVCGCLCCCLCVCLCLCVCVCGLTVYTLFCEARAQWPCTSL